MHEAPCIDLQVGCLDHFHMALLARDAGGIVSDVPVWAFLQWLVGQGYLLHGSQQAGLDLLQPSGKAYGQPDDFSNRAGVYAASDALWAMMYALRGPAAKGQIDICLRFKIRNGWSLPCYYYALGAAAGSAGPAKDLMAPGWVYVLGREGFEPSPPYRHLHFGLVQELNWVRPASVIPGHASRCWTAGFPLAGRCLRRGQDSSAIGQRPLGFSLARRLTGSGRPPTVRP